MDPLPEGVNVTNVPKTADFDNEELWQYHKARAALKAIKHMNGDDVESRRQDLNRRKEVFARQLIENRPDMLHINSSDEMEALCYMKSDGFKYPGMPRVQVGLDSMEYKNIQNLATLHEINYWDPNKKYYD